MDCTCVCCGKTILIDETVYLKVTDFETAELGYVCEDCVDTSTIMEDEA